MPTHADNPEPAPRQAPLGVSIVAGEPVTPDPGSETFAAINPRTGDALPTRFYAASIGNLNDAANAAWRAFHAARDHSPEDRATMLELIARRISGMAGAIIPRCMEETGLPEDRLAAELGRTTSTLELFARVIRNDTWKRIAIDLPEPRRKPTPRPGLRRVLVPLGPVAVFGSSNFPLAYSTAGTDAASALAAGCPVIVKGHPLHPGTGELVAQAVCGAVRDAGFPVGWFSFLHAGGAREHAVGAELVRHPCVRAAGFTGSFEGGAALAHVAAARPDPIPFFAEMGSTNPVFILPGSVETEPAGIAQHLARSISIFAGQQCTCPGLIFLVQGRATETCIERLGRELAEAPATPMLAARIRKRYLSLVERAIDTPGVRTVQGDNAAIRSAVARPVDSQPAFEKPFLMRTTEDVFLEQETLHDEIFGPAAIVVECKDAEGMLRCAGLVQGSLTGSIFLSNTDLDLARALTGILALRVGRVVFNGVPTGLEVGYATVHGGPYPATNRPDTTAVGPFALERWCRPVAFQNAPAALLPPELRDANEPGTHRIVQGSLTQESITPRKHS
ncbi:MAG: aldehyde dehydrogenase (NADP(+)) [Phycisphaeraceae bacterium]|nr:MAG: aldehyde dehydrogenase (NADP(+)) [Phycisphaeraceae bacterium]